MNDSVAANVQLIRSLLDARHADLGHAERAGDITADIAIVLGSGLGGFAESIPMTLRIPYADLKGFPATGVSGHAGELNLGLIDQTPVIVLSGRSHYYEGTGADVMRMPFETLRAMGVKSLILTNSAGSLREETPPGTVMRISDHINFSGTNPLIGETSEDRFVGMTHAYDEEWAREAEQAAGIEGIDLHQGVYMWFSGPSFETPAEIRAARILGADAVGMSTVPEVILARFLGLRVAAFSVMTNLGAGMSGSELSHQDTKTMAPLGGELLGRLLNRLIADAAK